MPAARPVWGADCAISMPLPAAEPALVAMFGFSMTQNRLVPDLSAAEYEDLSVPVYAPADVSSVIYDDVAVDFPQQPQSLQPVLTSTGVGPGGQETVIQGASGFVKQPPGSVIQVQTQLGQQVPAGVSIITVAVPPGLVGQAYVVTLTAVGGTKPYLWAATSLPPGLTLGASGTLTGTPTTAGTFSSAFTVTDASQPALTASATIYITIQSPPPPPPPLVIDTTSFPDAQVGTAVDEKAQAHGGVKPYSWGAS